MPVHAAVCLCLLLGRAPAHGQEPAPGVRPLDRSQVEAERLKKMLLGGSKAYIDRVMVPGDLPDLREDDGSRPASDLADGFQAWSSETRVQHSQTNDALRLRSSTALGQQIIYRRETINYGSYELLAEARAGRGITSSSFFSLQPEADDPGARVTFRSVDLPVTTSLFLDSAAGVIYSDITGALSRSERISLGTRPVLGASLRLHTDQSELRVGSGARGELAGGPFASFERTSGRFSWAGLSHNAGPLALGLQVNRADGLRNPLADPAAAADDLTVDSLAATAAYTARLWGSGSTQRIRLSYLRSRAGAAGFATENAQGALVEAAHTSQGEHLVAGAYAADPGLRFGESFAGLGERGAYARGDWFSTRLSWGGGAAYETAGAGLLGGERYVSLHGHLNYRIDRRNAVGAAVHAQSRRHGAADPAGERGEGSRSYHASVYYHRTPHLRGSDRFQLTVRRRDAVALNAPAATGEEFEWQHDWIRGTLDEQKPELVTSLGIARDRSEGQSTLTPTAGLNFRLYPDVGWTLAGNLRYTSSRSNLSASRGLSGSVDAEYQLADQWRVGASLSLNQARVSTDAVPLGAPRVLRSNERFVSAYVRWDDSAGASLTALGAGGSVRSRGAGGIEGVVFFDADRDGKRQIAENGAPGVEVLLDGRFRTTTDRNGRFVFPLVPTGTHAISVQLNSVPLPWGAPEEKAWTADVPLRGTATVDIPLVQGTP